MESVARQGRVRDVMSIQRVMLAGLLAIFLTGCQSHMVKPKVAAGSAAIQAIQYIPDSGDMPVGSFVPDGASLVIRKNPSNNVGIGMLFGQVGTLLAESSARRAAQEQSSIVGRLMDVPLKAEIDSLLNKMDSESKLGKHLKLASSAKGQDRFEVGAYLFLQISSKEKVQLSLIVRTAERGGEWVGQYIRHLPQYFTLDELQSGEMDFERLMASVRSHLELALDVMVADLNGNLGQPHEPGIKVSSPQILFFAYGEWTGSFVGRLDGGYNLVRSDCSSGDAACFGMHILDRDQARIRQHQRGS